MKDIIIILIVLTLALLVVIGDYMEEIINAEILRYTNNTNKELVKQEMRRTKSMLDELEKVMRYKGEAGDVIPVEDVSEFDEKEVKGYIRGYNDCIDKIKQKFAEMREGK